MKVIIDNVLNSVSASSAHASYPASNVTDDRPKLVWRANGVDTATLTCSNLGAFDTVAVFNTNAESVGAVISDPNELTFDGVTWDGITWYQAEAIIYGDLIEGGTSNVLWFELDETVTDTVNVELTLSAATGASVEAGVVVMGVQTEFSGPRYGLSQGVIDYSISREASNGSEYYKERDRVRTFSGEFLASRTGVDSEFYTFMNNLARDVGRIPLAWKLVDDGNNEWIVYARLTDMPEGSHAYPNHAPISFSIKEVL